MDHMQNYAHGRLSQIITDMRDLRDTLEREADNEDSGPNSYRAGCRLTAADVDAMIEQLCWLRRSIEGVGEE